MRLPALRPKPQRRGITLIEMLVTVALLLLVMTILVQIFRSATGALQGQRAYAQMDQSLRRFDATIRQDLIGCTAKFDPGGRIGPSGSPLLPASPTDNRGYFEYIENELSDLQGEDSDDILCFTSKAPEGVPFTGRVWVPATLAPGDPRAAVGSTFQTLRPITVTSQFAEVIYFLRNGNLYRRVLLILPERNDSLRYGNIPGDQPANDPTIPNASRTFGIATNLFGPTFPVSWQGLNDISAHPAPFRGPGVEPMPPTPVPNTLGNLTDRHFRFCRPRFTDDYQTTPPSGGDGSGLPDGQPDDENANGVPDYYPTLYPALHLRPDQSSGNPTALRGFDPATNAPRPLAGFDALAFPFIYPGSYSIPSPTTVTGGGTPLGAIHFLGVPNHNPVLAGESQYFDAASGTYISMPVPTLPAQLQTYWGFPTWKEMMSPNWTDPVKRLNADAPIGSQSPGLSWTATVALPPIPGPFSDGAGNATGASPPNPAANAGPGFVMPAVVFQDDLIMAGVRSFDVKVFDPDAARYNALLPAGSPPQYAPGYYDLGWAATITTATPTTNRTPPAIFNNPTTLDHPVGFGHEGRIPPLGASDSDATHTVAPTPGEDHRRDPNSSNFFIGDDGSAGAVIRLRRTFDTWSTTYSQAPAVPNNPFFGPGYPIPGGGGATFRPVYPSYPAPYPVPLTGLQIQIRVVDPGNQRVKMLTIRQDFSAKLN